jgi:hypothetical protein
MHSRRFTIPAGQLRNLADVELIAADYIAWYNQQRLVRRLGRIPSAEADAEYYDQRNARQPAGSQECLPCRSSAKAGLKAV